MVGEFGTIPIYSFCLILQNVTIVALVNLFSGMYSSKVLAQDCQVTNETMVEWEPNFHPLACCGLWAANQTF